MNFIDPETLHLKLNDGMEIALIDVREEGHFGASHLLTASCVPLRLLELRMLKLVPRLDARIIVCDDGADDDASARRAAQSLLSHGYKDVTVLAGGTRAWAEAGFVLFSGVNVPSKAFGEFVETRLGTPHISANDLAARQAKREVEDNTLVILDSRPMNEYHNMSIPGGIDCPGAELVYRAQVAAPDPGTTIVVNCAGRTRSIIGAQSLINANLPNPIMALENGTMGWHLAGHQVDRGKDATVAAPTGDALVVAQDRAAEVAREYGVRSIDKNEYEALKSRTARSLYLFDVRAPEEYVASHHPDAQSAPGGQLVQATDEYIAVRNSIVVLTDDTGVRANMTASWLRQLGWTDVYVLARDDTEVIEGSEPQRLLDFNPRPTITAIELRAVLDTSESCEVVDVENSLAYLRGHIPSAWWTSRTRLMTDLAFRPAPGLYVVTSADGVLAHYSAAIIEKLKPEAQVRVLAGGTDAWIGAGYDTDAGPNNGSPTEDYGDVFYKPYEYSDATKERMQDYIDWEVALVDRVVADGVLDFEKFRTRSRTDG